MNETIAVAGAGTSGLWPALLLAPQGASAVPAEGVGLAGDGLGGPRVEGAALSGLELAGRMAVGSNACTTW